MNQETIETADIEHVRKEFRKFLNNQEKKYQGLIEITRKDNHDAYRAIAARHQQVIYTKNVFEQILGGKTFDDV